MVIWKERQYDNDDALAERNTGCIVALRDCRPIKLFQTPSMVSHKRLLEHRLRMWNLEQQCFEVGAHILTVEVEDIYFLTSLSRQGAPISLSSSRGGDVTTQELINHHCVPGTRTLGKKIPIKAVMDGPLWNFLFMMQRVDGIQGVH